MQVFRHMPALKQNPTPAANMILAVMPTAGLAQILARTLAWNLNLTPADTLTLAMSAVCRENKDHLPLLPLTSWQPLEQARRSGQATEGEPPVLGSRGL